jgi:hypothetical protein
MRMHIRQGISDLSMENYGSKGYPGRSQSTACTVYDSLNIEIAGSNRARGMDVCLRVSVLCCPVFRYRPCVGLIPQPRSLTKCLWIEKSIKKGQGPIRTVEASGKKKGYPENQIHIIQEMGEGMTISNGEL